MSKNGTRNYLKNKVYNLQLYNELINEYWCKKDVPKEIHDYMVYCYHVEEYKAGLL